MCERDILNDLLVVAIIALLLAAAIGLLSVGSGCVQEGAVQIKVDVLVQAEDVGVSVD